MENVKPRVLSAEVRPGGRLPIPEYFRPVVCMDYPDDPATFWVVGTDAEIAALADEWVSTPRFKSVGRYDLLDGSRVHIAEDVVNDTALHGEPGDIVYFVWFPEEPGQDRPPLVFVLTEEQFWRVFPESETGLTYALLFGED